MTIHPAEQQALVDAVRSLLEKRADSAAVRRADGFDADLWRTLTEQIGVAALPIPEEHGGAGASIVESALVLDRAAHVCERFDGHGPSEPLTFVHMRALVAEGRHAEAVELWTLIAAAAPATGVLRLL